MQKGREIMRVLRDEQSGEVVVEVEGRVYKSIREISDGRVGHTVLQTIAELLKFTGGLVKPPTAKEAPPPSPQAAVVSDKKIREEEELLQKVASGEIGLEDNVALRLSLRPVEPSPSDFIKEINRIFQRYLLKAGMEGEPTNMVTTDLRGGLRIKIGAEYFGSPDEVANLTIRQMLKAAVKEWEG